MEIIIQPDSRSASRLAGRIVANLLREKPDAVLGLATGRTPFLLYNELCRMHREKGLDFGRVTSFNLDEYVGLEPSHPASYHSFMREHLFDQINMDKDRIHIPDGMTDDIPRCCKAYEEAIVQAGGIDLQILGIGSDGHIGFNEPTSSLASRTRIKTLTRETRSDNAPFFEKEEEMPRHVITMGVGTILDSRSIVLLAFGARKAQAVARTVEGPISAMAPASVLQLHRDVKVIIDEAAASKLEKSGYYREVFEGKPDWQKY